MTRAPTGVTLIEVLIGLVLGLGALAALTALVSGSLAARARAGAGAEALAATASAIDQIVRDVRLAGYDPLERGLAGMVAAAPASLVLQADLDGDGTIDGSSEERVTYRSSTATGSLLRIVGTQTMPLLSNLAPGGFRLRYFDASGSELDPATPAATDAIRAVTVDLQTLPNGTIPGVRMGGGARLLNR
jgi:Tfp pilus assembly protein PilW